MQSSSSRSLFYFVQKNNARCMNKLFLAIIGLLLLGAAGYWWLAQYNLADDSVVHTEVNAVKQAVDQYIPLERDDEHKTLSVSFATTKLSDIEHHDLFETPLPSYTPSDTLLADAEKIENIFTLNTPLTATRYDQSFASTPLYSLEILKGGTRHALYTEIESRVDSSMLSPDKTHVYITNAIEKNNAWVQVHRIITIDSKKIIELPAIDCVSEEGYWQGSDRLITYGATPELGGRESTPVCVWSADGSLLTRLTADLYWATDASAAYLYDAVGIVPQKPSLLWIYARSAEHECSLSVYDTETKQRDVQKVINGALDKSDDNNNRCAPIQINFSQYNGTAESITTEFVEADSPLDVIRSKNE